MHMFTELVDRCTNFTLSKLKEVNDQTIEALQTSSATSLVKTLQMIQMQKTIMAVGMFSLFESILQNRLNCKNGFAEAGRILHDENEAKLKQNFSDFQNAINVLKHGRGRSYDVLVAKAANLPFKVKHPAQDFFNEGDVSEISTLIEVDDNLIVGCSKIIQDVSAVIRRARPGIWI